MLDCLFCVTTQRNGAWDVRVRLRTQALVRTGRGTRVEEDDTTTVPRCVPHPWPAAQPRHRLASSGVRHALLIASSSAWVFVIVCLSLFTHNTPHHRSRWTDGGREGSTDPTLEGTARCPVGRWPRRREEREGWQHAPWWCVRLETVQLWELRTRDVARKNLQPLSKKVETTDCEHKSLAPRTDVRSDLHRQSSTVAPTWFAAIVPTAV
jgi:hypothetical protein